MAREFEDAEATDTPRSPGPARLDRVSLRVFLVSIIYLFVAVGYAIAQHAGLLDPNGSLFSLLARLAQ